MSLKQPLQQRPEQTSLEGQEEWLQAEHIAPLPGHCSTMLRGLPWAYGSSTGKRQTRVTCNIVGCSVGAPSPALPYRDCKGVCWTQLLGGVFQQKAFRSWQTKFLPAEPSGSPNPWICSSAEPNQGHKLTRELSGFQDCLLQVFKWGVLPGLQPGLPLPRQNCWVIAKPTVE